MARCPECRKSWREMEDEAPTECPFCGYTGHEHEEEGPDEEERPSHLDHEAGELAPDGHQCTYRGMGMWSCGHIDNEGGIDGD